MGGQSIAAHGLRSGRIMMKRSIANRIAALALALVLAGSLVPGAWAAEGEPEGGGQLTGVTVTPSNLSMKVGERASVRASAAGLSQDQMKDARIEWSLENNDPERVRIASGRDSWTVEVEAVNTAETTETDPVTLVATVTCQGGAERDTCAITVVPDQPAGLRITRRGIRSWSRVRPSSSGPRSPRRSRLSL